jgi:hypothetical protein
MNIKYLAYGALVTTAIFTSCGEKAVSNNESHSFIQSVAIIINGEYVYDKNDLKAPDEMIEIFNDFFDMNYNKEDRFIEIEFRYSLKQAENALIDSFCGISYEENPSKHYMLAMTNDPSGNEVPNEIRPSYDVAMSEIRERAKKTFDDWWNSKRLAEQDAPSNGG